MNFRFKMNAITLFRPLGLRYHWRGGSESLGVRRAVRSRETWPSRTADAKSRVAEATTCNRLVVCDSDVFSVGGAGALGAK